MKRIIEELIKENISYKILSWNQISIPFKFNPKVCLFRSVPDFKKEFSLPYLLTFIEDLERKGCKCFPASQDFYQADKATSLLIAKNEGIMIPEFILGENLSELEEFIKKHDKIVYKPLIGSKGEGIRILSKNIEHELEIFSRENEIIYLQKFIKNKNYDIRTIFIDGEMICQYVRENLNDFRNNISLGGTGYNPKNFKAKDSRIQSFLEESKKWGQILYKKMGLKIFGIDTIPSVDNKLYFLEINPILGFKGAESAININIATEIVHLIAKFL